MRSTAWTSATWTRTISPICATARSASSSRASISCPRTSALANVELPLAYAGLKGAERRRQAERALQLGGDEATACTTSRRSSPEGQQQRVAVARAIVTNPSLILADEPTGNLDSHSTEDVLAIFARLNEEGRTVVLITHEPDVAEQAKRVIRLSDGEIVEDHRSLGVHDAPPALARAEVRPISRRRPSWRRGHDRPQRCCASHGAGSPRTSSAPGLTILGMTIGVASVIVLIAVGNGSSKAVQSTIQSLGTNVLVVQASGGFRGGRASEHRGERLADQGRRRSAAEPQPGPGCQERLARRRRQRRVARLRRHELRTVLVRGHHAFLSDGPHLQDRRRRLVHLRRRQQAQARGGHRPGSRAGTVRRAERRRART